MSLKKYIESIVRSNPQITPKHGMPMTRRDLIAQGYLGAGAMVAMPSLFSLMASKARGEEALVCRAKAEGPSMVPFIIVDLGGGANIPGANVMVGGVGGQTDFLPKGSYGSIGLSPDIEPTAAGVTLNTEFGLAFHPESRLLAGLLGVTTETTRANVNGTVFATVSGDDTQNNPHNVMYWIAKAGARGKVVSLVGNDDTDSGGRAMSPPDSVDLANKPVVIRRNTDTRNLVLPGIVADLAGKEGADAVMKTINKLSFAQIDKLNGQGIDEQIAKVVKCGYMNSIEMVSEFEPTALDPQNDAAFTTGNLFNFNDGDENKAASVAKLVLDGYAGSGTITLGGYDYHGNPRATTDQRDDRAGRIIGKILEVAARKETPVMVYVFTDGGIACTVSADNLETATGRYNASGDSGQRSAAFTLVYNPKGKVEIRDGRNQIGAYQGSGSVNTQANAISNSVVNLSKAVVANYLALHGKEGDLGKVVGTDPFGADLDQYLAFGKIL